MSHPAEGTIRLLVVDDHPAFREGVRALLAPDESFDIVGEATTGTEAVEIASALQPDIVLMDLHIPELNGIDATRQIVRTSPHIGVLVLTMFDDDDSVFAAMRAGARGYLLKGAGRDELRRAVHAVGGGEAIYSPAIAQRIIAYFSATPRRTESIFPELTDREREVLTLIAAGESNTIIARRLTLNPKTVRNHISNIFNKLQVVDRAQAIVRARQAGLGVAQSGSQIERPHRG